MEGFLIIATLILMECILSIDNAAALATMVRHLPVEQRARALRYGILGAYFFRGLALLFASYLIHFSFLKWLGGMYLLNLALNFFMKQGGEDEVSSKYYSFWGTVASVEAMDMIFSVDNVFAAVALSDKLIFVCIGVAIGILAMRFVAGAFVKMLDRYPELESYAFIVIGILGFKLAGSVIAGWFGLHGIETFLESNMASMITSGFTICLFLFPFIRKYVKSA